MEEMVQKWVKYEELGVLSDEENILPNGYIELFEVQQAIKTSKVGKALGPDGLPLEVYKDLGESITTCSGAFQSQLGALDHQIAPTWESLSWAARSAAGQGVGEAAALLPSLDFLPCAGGVRGIGGPPDVELRDCRPCGVRYSTAWVGAVAWLVPPRYGIEEESEAQGFAPVGGPVHPWGRCSLAAQRGFLAGDCGGVARDQPGGLRYGPEEEGWCSLLESWLGGA
ncbi:hypothetical protein NDU88_005205 [Pleurodeles waltl]|uniref:Uncharacterized protein n=1 Tax=Pleurodeles waltl TaxID=8319 RepID=A0AAV7QEL9_PLEWA|nr:hypothetical protein NDU88_005205 [Pleurodeles waltl]